MSVSRNKKEISKLEFETVVKPVGNTAHILIPKNLVGKRVKVSIEAID